MMRDKWRSFQIDGRRGVGTIFAEAQAHGFDTSLRQYPELRGRLAKRKKNTDQQLHAEFLALAALVPKAGKLKHAIHALQTHANRSSVIAKRECAALHLILRHVNAAQGYAWPSYATIAAQSGHNVRAVRQAVTRLERAGYLARVPGDHLNPQGYRGPAFVPRPPNGISWDELITLDNGLMNHKQGDKDEKPPDRI